MRTRLILCLLLLGCTAARPPRVLGSLQPPRPLDALAAEAAAELFAAPETLTLDGANGLSRLGARLEREDWIAAADARFAARLADPTPLSSAEAEAFRERWAEVDLDPRWRARLLIEGLDATSGAWTPEQALDTCREALLGSDRNRLLAAWGRAHDWFGHVWIDGARAALAFDGFAIEPVAGAEPGWRLRDTLGVARRFALRRGGDHDSLMWIEAGGEVFAPAHFSGEGAGHEH